MNQTFRVVGFVVAGHMQTGDNDLEFGEHIVIEIDAILENINFNTAEQAKAGSFSAETPIELANGLDLLSNALGRESACLERRLGMVGDGPVLADQLLHVLGDLFKGVAAVAPVRVVVK